MTISNYAEDKLMDAVFNASTTGGGLPTADPYLQLHSGDPGEAGTTNAISHTRIQVPFPASSGGTLANTSAIDVLNMPVSTVMAWSFWDAVSAGNCLWTGWFATIFLTAQVDDEDLTNNDIESPTHGLAADDRVAFEVVNGLTIPAGLTAGTVYFVLATGLVDDMFRVSATSGGAAIDITAEGQAGVWKVTPKSVANLNDTFHINAGDLDVFLD